MGECLPQACGTEKAVCRPDSLRPALDAGWIRPASWSEGFLSTLWRVDRKHLAFRCACPDQMQATSCEHPKRVWQWGFVLLNGARDVGSEGDSEA